MRKPRVMILDDEPIIVDMMKSFFARRGYEVLSFTEPIVCPLYEGCSSSCEKKCPCADLVITDLKMHRLIWMRRPWRESGI